MDAPVARILVVEDEPVIRNLLKEVLSRDGREIVFAECAADGLARAKEAGGIDLALLDKNLRDGSGLDVARALKEMSPASMSPARSRK